MLETRQRVPEVMDSGELEPWEHVGALKALEKINQLSFSAALVWGPIWKAAKRQRGRPLKVLDIATGGGDLPVALKQAARKAKLEVQIDACDKSPVALQYAATRAEKSGEKLKFFELDALTDSIPEGYDVVMCSLFLHHLDDRDAAGLLVNMRRGAGQLVIVNDLLRSRAALALAYAASHLITQSHVVHTDAPRSVRAAFTIPEARLLFERAGMAEVKISARWPFRFLAVWRKDAGL